MRGKGLELERSSTGEHIMRRAGADIFCLSLVCDGASTLERSGKKGRVDGH
jgi:hypothetical protein